MVNLYCSEKDILNNERYRDSVFVDWHNRWLLRLMLNKKPIKKSFDLMKKNNPVVIPRNHRVEEALKAANTKGDLGPVHSLLDVLKKPYIKRSDITNYQLPPEPSKQAYKTFCGT